MLAPTSQSTDQCTPRLLASCVRPLQPTNYLDNDTLAVLTRELKAFKGGVVTVSHHESFVAALATEKWVVNNGTIEETVVLAKSKNDLPDFVAE